LLLSRFAVVSVLLSVSVSAAPVLLWIESLGMTEADRHWRRNTAYQ
jgi:hypothetical protein